MFWVDSFLGLPPGIGPLFSGQKLLVETTTYGYPIASCWIVKSVCAQDYIWIQEYTGHFSVGGGGVKSWGKHHWEFLEHSNPIEKTNVFQVVVGENEGLEVLVGGYLKHGCWPRTSELSFFLRPHFEFGVFLGACVGFLWDLKATR